MRKKVTAASIIGGLGLLGLFVWLTGPQFLKELLTYGRTFDFFLLVLVIGGGPTIFFIIKAATNYDQINGWSTRSRNSKTPSTWKRNTLIASVIGLATIGYFGYLCVAVSYDSAKHYVSSIAVTHNAIPSFDSRAPYKVAIASSNKNMQNVTGTADVTKSIADQGKTGEWNTLIIRRGIGVGYEAVQVIKTPLYGAVQSSEVNFCSFDAAKAPLRFGGALVQNNLGRVLDWTLPLDVSYNSSDAYAYCDGSTPYVVIPLKQVNGFYGAWETPYGDATYNGKTGEIKVLTKASDIAKLPGSTYPLSLAATQREATQAVGSLGDYNWGSTGFQTTANDTNDPNAENDSEFQLKLTKTGGIGFVTPLTVRGDSTSIVGISVVNSKAYTQGVLNKVNIYEYAPSKTRQANSTVEANIKSTYAGSSAWASGIQVFEIVPAENGTWVASIGQSQNVIWRAVISSDSGNSITLYKNGQLVTNMSTDTTSASTAPSTGAGTTTTPTDSSNIVNGVDLTKLTPAQLQQLGQQILAELAKRSTPTK